MNQTTSYSEIRKNLKSSFDQVCTKHLPLLINRRNGGNVVIVSQEDYESLEETAYLLRSPKNALRLSQALLRSSGKSLEEVKNELAI